MSSFIPGSRSPVSYRLIVFWFVFKSIDIFNWEMPFDLQKLFDELDANAMKAEKNYQGKLVEFKCKISSFDSDGSYISVEPVNASEWNFTTAMCYIKNDTQKDFLLDKNVGDEITIKGKIKSIGEILGYSIDIKEVS